MAVLAVALRMRVLEAQNHILYDLQHFYRFAETLFTSDHLNYYASVVTQPFTYAHLPLFPLLLAPVLRLYDAFGWEPVLAVKTLVYTFDLATALLLFVLARRNRLPAAGALLIAGLWLLSPWVLEAGAVNGHVTSVARSFLSPRCCVSGCLGRPGCCWRWRSPLAASSLSRLSRLPGCLRAAARVRPLDTSAGSAWWRV